MVATVQVAISDTNNRGISTLAFKNDLTGVESIRQFNKDFIDGHKQIARQALREEQNQGFPSNPRQRIDNRFDAPIDSLKVFGKVEYFAPIAANVAILEIYDAILRRSIVGDTRNFFRSNYVLVDNKVVAKSRLELKQYLESNKEKFTEFWYRNKIFIPDGFGGSP